MRERLPLRQHPVGLPVIHHAISIRLQQLRLAPSVQKRIPRDQIGHRRGILAPEFPRRPLPRKFPHPFRRPAFRRPGQVEKKFRRQRHMLQMSHIDNPDSVRAILVRQIHLLPNFRQRTGIHPFVIARIAHVIEMVINPRAPRPTALIRRRQPPQVAPIVIAP